MAKKHKFFRALSLVPIGMILLVISTCCTAKQIAPGAEETHTLTAHILVFEDLNGDGEQSKGESPIPDTLVVATTNVHGNFFQHTTLTDEDGKTSLQAEYTHYFDIQAITPCGYVRTTPEVLSAVGKLPSTKYRFGFQPTNPENIKPTEKSLRFQVWQDINRDGIRQPSESPLSGVELAFAPAPNDSAQPTHISDVGSFYSNAFSTTTDEYGKATLNVGNSCGTLEVALVAGWDTTAFSLDHEIKENGTMTFDYDDNTPEISWGLSKYESFTLRTGSAYHPEGMGEWVIHLYADGTFSARHNVQDTTTKYGPYTLTDEETQELWALVAAADIESLPRTFERPGVPDETAYEFSLHTVDQVYLSEMWVDDAKEIPELHALVEQLIYLLEIYTKQKY